jgi:hypothetical protein
MDTITASDFSTTVPRLIGPRGWKSRFARQIGRNRSTVNRWANGEEEVPPYAIAIIELLQAAPRGNWPKRFHP